MPPSDLLEYDEDVRIALLKKYGRTPESVKADIDSIRNWASKQPHLPKVPSDQQIETILFIAKFVFAKAKTILDMYYSLRGILPEFFRDPEDPAVISAGDMLYWITFPKLTQTYSRIVFMKMKANCDYQDLDATAFYSYVVNVTQILIQEDCNGPKILIFDVEDVKMELITAFSPLIIKKSLSLYQKIFSSRVEGVHLLNAASSLDTVITLIKSFLKPKIAERIYFHKNLDSLYEYVPKEIFPKDYGGTERSLGALDELWRNKIKSYIPYIRAENLLRSDESKRREGTLDSELLGFEGNFRKLNVD